MKRMSNKLNPKKARIGDIVEIATPAGLGYVQYTHDGGTNGELVRVLPGLFANRPTDMAELARQKELYFVFFILNYGFRTGIGQMEVVSHQPIPDWAIPHPTMRHAAAWDNFGRVIRWRIISAANGLTLNELIGTPLLTELTPEQKKLSIYVIWPPAVMVEELARGWTPERAEELRLQDFAEAAAKKASQASGKDISDEPMKFFLYFPEEPNAKEAGERLRSRGFSVEVSEGASGENWCVLATRAMPKTGEEMDELRDEMETLATQFGGDYDGWEAPLASHSSANAANPHRVN